MNEIPNIFKDLHKVKQSAQIAEGLRGRITGSKLGVVVENQDPEDIRRIKVQFHFMPKGVNSHWIMRASTSQGRDEPVPEIGQTVLVDFVNGDVSKGFYRVIQNLINTPHEVKDNSLLDDSLIIDGNKYVKIAGKHDIASSSEVKDVDTSIQTTSESNTTSTDTSFSVDAGTVIDLEAGQKVTIKAGGGTILTVDATGAITLTAPTTLSVVTPVISLATGGITMSGFNGGSVGTATLNVDELNLNGKFNVTGKTKVGGKDVAVVGAKDTDGDTVVSSGQ